MKKLLSALFLLALCSSLAMATVPDPTYCSVAPLFGTVNQGVIIAPGNLAGTTLTITVKNSSNVAIPNATVAVTFMNQPNQHIGICTSAVHTATTQSNGTCTIALRGGGCLMNTVGACIVTANGVEIKNIKFVKSPDNGAHLLCSPDGHVDTVDLQFFASEFKLQAPANCHDYNNDGTCDTVDLTYFADAFKGNMVCTLQ